jgi:hypothetical protein
MIVPGRTRAYALGLPTIVCGESADSATGTRGEGRRNRAATASRAARTLLVFAVSLARELDVYIDLAHLAERPMQPDLFVIERPAAASACAVFHGVDAGSGVVVRIAAVGAGLASPALALWAGRPLEGAGHRSREHWIEPDRPVAVGIAPATATTALAGDVASSVTCFARFVCHGSFLDRVADQPAPQSSKRFRSR